MFEAYERDFYTKFRENKVIRMLEDIQPVLNDMEESNIEETYVFIVDNGFINQDLLTFLYNEVLWIGTISITNQKAFIALFRKLYEKYPIDIKDIVFKIRFLFKHPYYGTLKFIEHCEREGIISLVTDESLYKKYLKAKKNLRTNENVIEALNNDDVDRLQELTSALDFNFKFVYNFVLTDEVKWLFIMDYACFIGATKCVKFLWANYHLDLNMKFAILGGNAEIIRFLEQENIKIRPYHISNAIEYQRYDVYDWLYEKFVDFLSGNNMKIYSRISAQRNWVHGIKCMTKNMISPAVKEKILNNVCTVIQKINYDFSSVIESIKTGDIEKVKEEINSSNVNFLLYANYFNEMFYVSPIVVACRFNQVEIVKFLLKIPGINVFGKVSRRVDNAMCQAIAGSSSEIIEMLLKLPGAKKCIKKYDILKYCAENDDVDILKLILKHNETKSANGTISYGDISLTCGASYAVRNYKINLLRYYIDVLKVIPDLNILMSLENNYDHDTAAEILKIKIIDNDLINILERIAKLATEKGDYDIMALMSDIQNVNFVTLAYKWKINDLDETKSSIYGKIYNNVLTFLEGRISKEKFEEVRHALKGDST